MEIISIQLFLSRAIVNQIFDPVGMSTLGPAVFGLFGLFSRSQSASQVTGSEGFFLHNEVRPFRRVGLT